MAARRDIARRRLTNQHLVGSPFTNPRELVEALGAVQAQDFAGAKWAIGLRTQGLQDGDVEEAFTRGAIIRTHVLRPTWHFVSPADVRWMLELTAPHVHAACASRYRELELDAAVFRRSRAVLERSLRGRSLTRAELGQAYRRARIETDAPQRLVFLLVNAELDGLICSGPRRGKQFTYVLLDERVPPSPPIDRDEAMGELTRRYFATRGPATPRDYAWWSGLTMAEVKRGLEIARSDLCREVIEGEPYWLGNADRAGAGATNGAHLLPSFDEYSVGFKDRSAIGEALERAGVRAPGEAFLANVVVVDGQMIGGWKRTFEKNAVRVDLVPLLSIRPAARRAIAAAAKRFGDFFGLPVRLIPAQ